MVERLTIVLAAHRDLNAFVGLHLGRLISDSISRQSTSVHQLQRDGCVYLTHHFRTTECELVASGDTSQRGSFRDPPFIRLREDLLDCQSGLTVFPVRGVRNSWSSSGLESFRIEGNHAVFNQLQVNAKFGSTTTIDGEYKTHY